MGAPDALCRVDRPKALAHMLDPGLELAHLRKRFDAHPPGQEQKGPFGRLHCVGSVVEVGDRVQEPLLVGVPTVGVHAADPGDGGGAGHKQVVEVSHVAFKDGVDHGGQDVHCCKDAGRPPSPHSEIWVASDPNAPRVAVRAGDLLGGEQRDA